MNALENLLFDKQTKTIHFRINEYQFSINIIIHMLLTQCHSRYPVILPLGKLTSSIDYFSKLCICIGTHKKVGVVALAVWLFPV